MSTPEPGCLSDEAVLAFAQGRLPPAEVAGAEAHLRGCEACRTLVAEAARTLHEGESSPAAVSRYVVLEPRGAGGAGVVYIAWDPQLRRKVALKLLRPVEGPEADASARLVAEAQAMARLSHPNVVSVHDAGTHEGQVFLVMELVEGRTLAEWLAERPRSWPEVLALFEQAGRGLAAAHRAGLVHRDFKPENVLVDGEGRARVTDFGLARAAPGAGEPGPDTRPAELAGTPLYMAPEQLLGREADARTDQFGFCVALHLALSGRHPFGEEGRDLPARARAVVEGRLRPALAREVPRWARAVLARGLAADPADRHPSMEALLAALGRGRRRARAARAAAVALAGAAGLAGAGLWALAPRAAQGGPTCGNGVREIGEECDDGNQDEDDGCTARCVRCAAGVARLVWKDNGHCYWREDEPLGWEAAGARCRAEGGHLVAYGSFAELAAVRSLLAGTQGPYWTGLHDRERKGYGWITGEPLTHAWQGWGTAPRAPGGCAATAADAPWAVLPCDAPAGFLCENPGWVLRPDGQRAYKGFYRVRAWDEARAGCERLGARLLTLADRDESAFVSAQLFGAHWVGARRVGAGEPFSWITGAPVATDLFGEGDPDMTTFPACVALGEDRRLRDRPCDGAEYGPYGYVCEEAPARR